MNFYALNADKGLLEEDLDELSLWNSATSGRGGGTSPDLLFFREGFFEPFPFERNQSSPISTRGVLPAEKYNYWGNEAAHDIPPRGDDGPKYGTPSYVSFEQEVARFDLHSDRDIPHPDKRPRRFKPGSYAMRFSDGCIVTSGQLATGSATTSQIKYQITARTSFVFTTDETNATYLVLIWPTKWFSTDGQVGRYILSVRRSITKQELFARHIGGDDFPAGRLIIMPIQRDLINDYYQNPVLEGDEIEVQISHFGYASSSSGQVLLSGTSGLGLISTDIA